MTLNALVPIVTTLTVRSVLMAAVVLLHVLPAAAGSPIISANPHPVACPASAPPQVAVANDPEVDANAYHTLGSNSTCTVNTVTASSFPSYGKPKIISSDGGRWTTNQEVTDWMATIVAAGAHYEHFEQLFDAACTGTCPMEGDIISDASDFPGGSHSIRVALGQHATRLLPNGLLTRLNDKFYWTGSGSPITLMGYSWMGALTGLNFDIDGYLDVLQSYGINLTRVWAIEQWTALAVDAPDAPRVSNGLTPFGGNLTSKWNLNQLNNVFFSRAKRFVQAAADRGIVVQFTLFEHVGLLKSASEYGNSLGSPYNKANNVNGYFDYDPVASGKAPSGFTGRDGTAIGTVHRAFLARVARELGAYENVIFEIMNEPSDGEWPDDDAWHQWVADVLRAEFAKTLVTAPTPAPQSIVAGGTALFTVTASGTAPLSYRWQRQPPTGGTFVSLADDGRISGSGTPSLRIASVASADAGNYRCLVSSTSSGPANSGPASLTLTSGGLAVRDGFGAADGTALNGKPTEAGGKVWTADNVKVSAQKATSNNEASEWRILAGVPVSLSGLRTATVEADLRQQATGVIAVGFPAASPVAVFEQTNNGLWVEFSRAGLLSLKKRSSGVVTTLASVDMGLLGFAVGNTVNVRLVYRTLPSPRCDVYINSVRRITNALVGFSPTIPYAGFQARRGSSTLPYFEGDGEVDNFVVTLSAQ